jgi:D-alanine--D-alanine ligase
MPRPAIPAETPKWYPEDSSTPRPSPTSAPDPHNMRICLCFGGPSDERNISAGSLKPWVTWLSAEPSVELSVLFFDRRADAWILPPVYFYANTCEDFESQLPADAALAGESLKKYLAGQDVVVPLIHGRFGEDGEFQESLEEIGVPYVFSAPEALAATMDKARCYERLVNAGLPVPAHLVFDAEEWSSNPEGVYARALELIARSAPEEGPALAVKPLRGGSSFGVSLISAAFSAFAEAVREALRQDSSVLVEEVLEGTEFSVVVLERECGPVALIPTEVVKRSALYDTRAKYLHGEGALLHTPLRRAESIAPLRRAARLAFEATGLRDMARIDGFLGADGRVLVTDINGIAGMGFSSFGFLQTSMVGLAHADLICDLVNRAARRGGREELHLSSRHAGRGRIQVLLGGPTSERQVSRQSGTFVGLCLQARGYDVSFVLMDVSCRFTEIGLFYALHHDVEEITALIAAPLERSAGRRLATEIAEELGLPPEQSDRHTFVGPTTVLEPAVRAADFVFLALHGGPGENGTMQAALEALGIPYNGCGPEASRLCSDKLAAVERVASRSLPGVGVPRQRSVTTFELLDRLRAGDWHSWFRELQRELCSRRIICKPATDGCSTGVKLLSDEKELAAFAHAIVGMKPFIEAGDLAPDSRPMKMPEPPPERWLFEEAFVEEEEPPLPEEDRNAANLEAWLKAKRYLEITGAVIESSTGEVEAAIPSLAVATGDELSLEEKFQQGVGTNLELDSLLDRDVVDSIRSRVRAIAEALGVRGYARIDCFYDRREDRLHLLEANTLCGLTEATVFYSQALSSFDRSPARILEQIVEVGLGRERGTLIPHPPPGGEAYDASCRTAATSIPER